MPTDQDETHGQTTASGSRLLPFLKASRNWWLWPVMIVFAVVAGLVLLSLFSGEHAVPTGL